MNREANGTETGWLSKIRDHWPWIAPSAYVYVSVIGIADSFIRFNSFGINVFEFAELNDFILAAFREPQSFLFVVGFALYGSLPILLGRFLKLVRFLRPTSQLGKRFFAFLGRLYKTLAILSLILAPLLPQLYNSHYRDDWKSELLSAEDSRFEVTIKSVGTEAHVVHDDLILIGTTSKYIFLSDSSGTMTIVPHSNVQTIRKHP